MSEQRHLDGRHTRGTGITQWAFLLALAMGLVAGFPTLASPAEFADPEGVNAEMQENLLKKRITILAGDLLGDQLLEVVAHVGYVRAERKATGEEAARIKLPGFNSFIDAKDANQQIIPEYARVRQVFIIVSNSEDIDTKAVEKELRRQAKFDSKAGDWLELVSVNQSALEAEGAPGGRMSESAEAAAPKRADAATLSQKRMPRTVAEETLREAKSTSYLLRARSFYFERDYHRALGQILQAIRIKPDNAQAYTMLGSIYYTMNWRSLALKYWDQALTLDPENREIADLVTELRVGDTSVSPATGQ